MSAHHQTPAAGAGEPGMPPGFVLDIAPELLGKLDFRVNAEESGAIRLSIRVAGQRPSSPPPPATRTTQHARPRPASQPTPTERPSRHPEGAGGSEWQAWLMRWAAEMRAAKRSESGIRQHELRVGFFMDFTGLHQYADVTVDEVFAWREQLATVGQPHPNGRARPAGTKAQTNHIVAMRNYWKWLQGVGVVDRFGNPFESLVIPKKLTETQRAFTAEEVVALIEAAERDERATQPQVKWADGGTLHRSTLYRALALTGMRIGEAARVKWRHLKLVQEPYTLLVVATHGKTNKERTFTLPPAVRDALQDWRAQTPLSTPDDLVWKRPRTAVIQADAERAGLDVEDHAGRRLGFHCFRRFAATELAAQGVSAKVAQQLLGHRDIGTTLKFYTDEQRLDTAKAVETLGAIAGHQTQGRTASAG